MRVVLEIRSSDDIFVEEVNVEFERSYHFKKICKERKRKRLVEISFDHWVRPISIFPEQDLSVLESNHCVVHLFYTLKFKNTAFQKFCSLNTINSITIKHVEENI